MNDKVCPKREKILVELNKKWNMERGSELTLYNIQVGIPEPPKLKTDRIEETRNTTNMCTQR
jgi:hypothetical protein